MLEVAYSLGMLLFSVLAFTLDWMFGLGVALALILIVNVVFLTLTALSFTAWWPSRYRS
jgi:hypothetical protein